MNQSTFFVFIFYRIPPKADEVAAVKSIVKKNSETSAVRSPKQQRTPKSGRNGGSGKKASKTMSSPKLKMKQKANVNVEEMLNKLQRNADPTNKGKVLLYVI